MRKASDLRELRTLDRPLTLAIGVFDGVHLGHQALVAKAREEAARVQGEAWVLTFDPHPVRVLRPGDTPRLLTSTTHKLALLAEQGLAGCVVLPFTRTFADTEPRAFVADLLAAAPSLRALVVGCNWRFGKEAAGDCALLTDLLAASGRNTFCLDAVRLAGEPVSSTRIRAAVEAGRLDEAESMLGRPFEIQGEVIHGKKRGRAIGFPTANVAPDNEVEPPPGIYVVQALWREHLYNGAAYLGASAGVGSERVVEVHLFDFDADLYGEQLTIRFRHPIRPDQRFSNTAALQEQIAQDLAAARAWLAG